MATLDDIARALGISKGTVSKALSGARDVSKSMRQAVLEKAVELGYRRSHRQTSAQRIALFLIHMEYTQPEDFGYELVVGFRKAAEPAGYHVEVISLDQQTQLAHSYDEYMVMGNFCSGVFLGMSLPDPWMKDFQDCTTPTVLYDNHISGNPHVTHVGVDNAEGMALAVSHLKALGHRKIGYLSSALDSYVYQQRHQAFYQAMTSQQLYADPGLTGNAYLIHDCLSQHLPRLLGANCTAIVCSHDLLAHSVIIHCAELGLRVPQDISVVGFDDIALSRYTMPPLTTIRQDRTKLGKSAFFALTSLLSGIPVSTFLLHPDLILRSSTATPKKAPREIPTIVTHR